MNRAVVPALPLCAVVFLAAAALGACSSESGEAVAKAKRAKPAHLVETAPASLDSLHVTSDREGTLRALREVKIFNQEEGRVTAVRAREGDSVKQGQVLIELDDALLRAEHDKALATLRQEELNAQRLAQLHEKKLVSEDALTRAQTALSVAAAQERALRTRLGYMRLTAPFAGRIARRAIEPGDVAPKHTHLMTVVDPSMLVTDVQVSELVLPQIRIGDRAEVRIDALGDQAFPGEVIRIYPTVDPQTRRGQIEVSLKPVPPLARPGLFCRVTLFSEGRNQIVIPHAALRRDAEGEYVFLFEHEGAEAGAGKVKRVNVRSGLRASNRVEIRSGLAVGQQVVAKGFVGLADGASVKTVTPQPKMPAQEKTPAKRDGNA